MKRAIIVHGFKGKPDTNWKPWLKSELETKGFQVEIPEMPNTDHPQASAWVAKLASAIGEMGSDEIYLIGHSLGCITILKYLETLSDDQKIKACIFVAGFTKRFEGYNGGHESFFENELNLRHIKTHVDTIIAVQSEDDSNVGFEELKDFGDSLGARTIAVTDMGHFSSADGVFEVPLVRDLILELE